VSTSAIGTVLDAIRAALIIRANLAGVNVFTGTVSHEEAGTECIAFGGGRLTEIAAAMGGHRLETWEVDGEIRVVSQTWAGTTETSAKAARDRTLALFAELETHLNDTYTGAMPDVCVSSAEMSNEYGPDYRFCSLRFGLTVSGLKNP
jgi:hypothetical protein